MMGWIPASAGLAVAIAWPLAIALGQMGLAWRQGTIRRLSLSPLWLSAPLPALLIVFLASSGTLEIEGWLLGGEWALDGWRRALLGFTALLWFLSGLYARGYLADEIDNAKGGDLASGRRLLVLLVCWPLTLTGNLLLIVAEDIASFYTGFTLMSFAAYALVVHDGTRESRHAGGAYLLMAVLGEAVFLGGILWAAGEAQTLTLTGLRETVAASPRGATIATLLWLGLGVKAGVVLVHVWLPLAHPVAPTPASAVLSGAMIKAGMIGWWQTLPLGDVTFEPLGKAVLIAGLAGAYLAALYGVTQRHPKAVLAYSSISQMGMLTTLFGVGLYKPEAWPALAPAVILFAVHHGLTKGALFLGVGISEHPPRLPAWLMWGLLVLPALSLSGALASGLVSKYAFKSALSEHDASLIAKALSGAAVGTAILVARALWRQHTNWRQARQDDVAPAPGAMTLAWGACVVLAASVPWWLPLPDGKPSLPPLKELKSLLWPLGVGILLALAAWALSRRRKGAELIERLERLPAGDLWWPYAKLASAIQHIVLSAVDALTRVYKTGSTNLSQGLSHTTDRGLVFQSWGDERLMRWAPLIMLGVAVGLGVALYLW